MSTWLNTLDGSVVTSDTPYGAFWVLIPDPPTPGSIPTKFRDASGKWVFDSWQSDVKKQTNITVDDQITQVETSNPITHRSLREGFLVCAAVAPAINTIIGNIEAQLNAIITAINTVPGVSVASASVGRIPDLTRTPGMQRLAVLDATIAALRNQRM